MLDMDDTFVLLSQQMADGDACCDGARTNTSLKTLAYIESAYGQQRHASIQVQT